MGSPMLRKLALISTLLAQTAALSAVQKSYSNDTIQCELLIAGMEKTLTPQFSLGVEFEIERFLAYVSSGGVGAKPTTDHWMKSAKARAPAVEVNAFIAQAVGGC